MKHRKQRSVKVAAEELPYLSVSEMRRVMQRLFKECEDTRRSGQKEYAGGRNAFGNFNRLSTMLESTPEKVLWVYAVKHFDGISSWIRGHKSQREPVRGRIKDAIIYLCLLAGIDEARQKGSVTS